jgi:hypothetical protein
VFVQTCQPGTVANALHTSCTPCDAGTRQENDLCIGTPRLYPNHASMLLLSTDWLPVDFNIRCCLLFEC